MQRYLTAEDVIDIHNRLVVVFADDGDPISPHGVRDTNLIEMAVHRPQTSLGGIEKYRSIESKAAALFHSLVQNHPFHNGNKRTALVSTVRYLDLNRRRVYGTDDELFDLVTSVADGTLPDASGRLTVEEVVEGVRAWFMRHTFPTQERIREMRIEEFLARASESGCRVRRTADRQDWYIQGPQWDLRQPRRSIVIRVRNGKTLPGNVVKRYAHELGITEGKAGITFEEFHSGLYPGQELIRQLMAVLRRLARV
ncbi:type II toxin-antitoxin system death-on-curing family toxin [Ralstonia solanacearum]